MKFPAFTYIRPVSLSDALDALADDEEAIPMAGGQSLLTMLSFRIAHPSRIVDIGGLAELRQIECLGDGIRIGSSITHAELEDGAVQGPIGRFLADCAAGIAFRAIRTKGTIGGSLAHADPAADWPVVLASLDATIDVSGPNGRRSLTIPELIEGQMQTSLKPGELIVSVTIPLAAWRRFGFYKSARKAGEFAEALAVVSVGKDGPGVWIGVLGGRPLRLAAEIDPDELCGDQRLTGTASYMALLKAIEHAASDVDAYAAHLSAIAGCRAIQEAYSREPFHE
jgi:aerobic carbon-monoxide dehydrogenase medium subunit